jgi:putative FmdB family regulatory protein
MPTYEYICEACGNEFENFASMSAPPVKKCPKCKKNKVHRKISTGGGIIFKGGGFYETDYRNDAYKKAAEADKPSETKAETTTDSKPAETTKAADASAAPAKAETPKQAEPKPAPVAAESKPAAKSSSSKGKRK